MRKRHVRTLGVLMAVVMVVSVGTALAATAGSHNPLVGIQWTPGTDSPFNASRFDGELDSRTGRIYFLGFRTDADATDGSVWYYKIATKTYVDTGVDMPVPVSNYEVAKLKDSAGNLGFYIYGGRGADGADVTTTQAYYPDTKTTKVFNADPWPGTTPSGCSDLPANGVAVVDNLAYVIGGISFGDECVDDQSAQTWIFDAKATKGHHWTQGPSMHVARGYVTPAVLNGTIYAIGGDQNEAGSLIPVDTVESFTPPSGKWINRGVADLPEPCDESQAFGFTKGPLKNGVLLAGCGQWPNAVPDTLFYDVASNSWAIIGALNTNRRNFAGALIPGTKPKVLILGGYGEDSGFVDPIASAEIGKGTTASLESRPAGRISAGRASLR